MPIELSNKRKDKADRYKSLFRLTKLTVTDTVLLFIAWSGFFREGFGEDTLSFYFTEISSYYNVDAALEYGRYAHYGLSKLLQNAGFYPEEHYRLVFLVFLLMSASAAAIVQSDFRAHWQTTGLWSRITDACILMPFVSGLFADNLGFPEVTLYFGLSYLFGALVFHAMTRGKWPAGFVLGLAAVGMYQVSAVLVFLWFLAWDFADHDGRIRMKPLRERFAALVVLLGPVLVDACVMTALAKNGVTDSSKQFAIPAVRWVLRDLGYLSYSFFVRHMWLTPALCFPLILLAGSFLLIARVCGKDGEWGRLPDFAVFVLVQYLAAFSLTFVMGGGLEYPGRMSFLLWCACGVILLSCGLVYMRETTDCGNGVIPKGLWYVLALMLAVFFFFDGQIAVNHAVSNAEDVHNARLVLQKVRNYEEETGNTVTYLTVLKDAQVNSQYEDVYYTYSSLNSRSMGLTTISLLNYVSLPERRFLPKDDELPQEMERYAADHDWDSFDPDRQVILDGDRVYWVIY